MSELLTNDQVAALVEAAQQGELSDEQSGGHRSHTPARRGRRLRSVDFARPTKFTSEHERRIVRALDAFCTTAATRLSAELRVPLELEVIDTTQLPWSSAQSAIPADSVGAALAVSPVGTRMLLTAELPLVLLTIEHLLGGAPERPPKARKLSEIDWALTKRLFEMLTHHLSLVWQDLAGLTLAEAADPRSAAAVRRAVAGAEVVLRAEVAHVELAIDDVLALAPGDLVRLGAPAEAGVGIYAEDVPIHRAQPGRSGTRRAVQVLAPGGGV